MCCSGFVRFKPFINQPCDVAGVSVRLGSCVYDFPHIASLYVKNSPFDSWDWKVSRLKSRYLSPGFQHLISPQNTFNVSSVFSSVSFQMSAFRDQGCATHIAGPLYKWWGDMKVCIKTAIIYIHLLPFMFCFPPSGLLWFLEGCQVPHTFSGLV